MSSEPVNSEKGNFDLFDAREYLSVLIANVGLLQDIPAHVKFFSQFADNSITVLDYGGGPNLFPLIVGAEKVTRYVHADYAPNNRDEVKKWKLKDPQAFSWKENIRRCLKVEGKDATDEEVLRREERMRGVLESVVYCDAKSDKPIEEGYEGPYDIVTCSLCLECVFHTMEALSEAIGRISALVKPGGYFVLTVSGVTAEECTPYYFDQIPVAGFKYDGFLLSPAHYYVEALKANGYTDIQQVLHSYHHPSVDVDDIVAIHFARKPKLEKY